MVLPNQLTVLRIILTPVFLYFFLSENSALKQLSIIIYTIAAITDWYDGWLARKFNYITDWGKFMDPLADKILTSTAFIGFVITGVLELWMVLLIIVRDFVITGLRSYAEFNDITFLTNRFAKWKTFIQMLFLYYLLIIYTVMTFESIYGENKEFYEALMNPTLIYYSMLAVTLITLLSGIYYIYKNNRLLKRLFGQEN